MDKRKIYLSVFAFGFSAMAIQIVLMRELLVVFYGNELTYGIMLASWLFWIAAGSLAARIKRFEEEIFHILLLSISIIAPATIYLIRDTRNILGVSAGELIGLLPMALSTFILLAPACLVFGSLFAVSCRLAAREPHATAGSTGNIYAAESLGAFAGGLGFNFLLVYILSPLQIALFCGLLNIIAVTAMADRKKAPIRWGATFVFMCCVAIYILTGSGAADFRMREMQWKGLELIAVRDSKYGNIALARLGSQLNLFENGLLTAATKDPLTAEESVHYALLEHPAPDRVLLIGGALNGALDEVLKEPVKSVDCVELDPDTTDLVKESYGDTLPKGRVSPLLACLSDRRVKMHYLDARLFVKERVRAQDAKYDVIILTLPNPYTAQINRFYSLEFYREVRRLLDARGIFSFGVTSSADYISGDQAQFLGCIYKTLKGEFTDIKILPGGTAFFFASPSGNILTYDYKVLEGRITERNLNLNFVNRHYLPDKFQTMRIEYLEKAVKDAYHGARINRDFKPIGYFYDMVLWSARLTHSSRLKDFFKKMDEINPNVIAVILLAAFAGLSVFQRFSRRSKNMAVVLSIGTTGFSTMLLQVVIIIAFQVIFGYVYQKIGLIFASFMLGLAGGSLIAVKLTGKNGDFRAIYRKTQLALCIYSFALPFVLRIPVAGEIIFSLLPAVAGIIGGMQFPLANKICAANVKDAGKIAGSLYGVDLIGACAGALVTSAFFIPVFGIEATCYLTGLLNALVFGLLLNENQLFLSKT
ncbi:MAG: hypothetical protein A3F87_04065 [Omnitrophica WOR_2 bacterium RIFCSPLOWO2_12_FULL_51_24]|nr:MAG: hypothetical protein A3F87_04065 [Omnitrophica WOR_2 bacterium RIFCSPLOWO2_12_FULL_51_24]